MNGCQPPTRTGLKHTGGPQGSPEVKEARMSEIPESDPYDRMAPEVAEYIDQLKAHITELKESNKALLEDAKFAATSEAALKPFAKEGGSYWSLKHDDGSFVDCEDEKVVCQVIPRHKASSITVGDFRRAAEVLKGSE